MKINTRRMLLSAMLAAICCVVTTFLKIPSPFKGYINLGDCIVLLCGWVLSPIYGFLAAGLGSLFADVFAGYVMYAPVTFVIKGAMALIANYCFRSMHSRFGNTVSRIVGGVLAEIIMVLGYFVFEGFLYGFVPSAVNIPINAVQGIAGLIAGIILARVFDKTKII